ncbi:hypothetical protein FSP39_012453 [Pinctada imbricata]|uniref:Uncharacterized protein n=1 Tax=Pinctada imbricata TaxID=66713 RepID=A0AA89BPF7_PINIB|nr:hypothetical protein FSP39_012453 [Pinctada imbricata]
MLKFLPQTDKQTDGPKAICPRFFDYGGLEIHMQQKNKFCFHDQTFRRCETDLGQDECIDCPLNYFNCEVIDTVSENAANLVRTDMLDEICRKNPTCLPGSILKEGDICRYMETGDYCECDRKNLFIGDDWNTCTVIKSMALKSRIQQQGQELKQNGTVGPCDEGFYKDKDDLSTCKRWTHAGVFVLAVIVLISITIYLRCGSQISEFFKHINIRSPDHTLPITALQVPLTSANDGNQGASDNEQLQASQSSQLSSCHTNDKVETCTEQTYLKSETDVLPNTMQDNESLTWGNYSAHYKQDHEGNTSGHYHQSMENKNISTASSSSDGSSCHDKPTAKVTPFKQDNTMEEPPVPNNTDSLRLTSAPPLDSLLT